MEELYEELWALADLLEVVEAAIEHGSWDWTVDLGLGDSNLRVVRRARDIIGNAVVESDGFFQVADVIPQHVPELYQEPVATLADHVSTRRAA